MASYSQAVESIIQGMSQQPDKYMIEGQCREQINCVSSPIEGVVKRPSAVHLAKMTWLDPNKEYTHFGLQVGGVFYNISLDTNFLYIAKELELSQTFDIMGNVNGYIGNDRESLKIYYLDDVIYILNDKRIVLMQETDAVQHNVSGSVEVVGVSTGKNINAYFRVFDRADDSLVADIYSNYTMASGDTVNDVATEIYNDFVADAAGYMDFSINRSTITGKLAPEYFRDYYVRSDIDDEGYNTYIKGYGGEVPTKADLPIKGYAGQRMKVNATTGEAEDLYFMFVPSESSVADITDSIEIEFAYDDRLFKRDFTIDSEETVKIVSDFEDTQVTTVAAITAENYDIYKPDDTILAIGDSIDIGAVTGTELRFVRKDVGVATTYGAWVETAQAGTNSILNMSMPIRLVPEGTNGDILWSLEESDWLPRNAGNTTSSKLPTFVNKTINSLYESSGRLILAHNSGVFLSETGNPENLWRVTASDLLVTDAYPLDGSNLEGNVYTPISLNGQIYVWGNQEQLRVNGQTLSLTTSALDSVSTYTSDPAIPPVVTGDVIHYVSKTDKYNVIQTYAVKPGTTDSMGSETISDQIATLIPGQVKQLLSNYTMNTLFVTTEEEPNRLYMYNFYKVDNQLRQSAWSILDFDFEIKYIYTASNAFRIIGILDNNYQILELDLKDLARPEKIILDVKQDLDFVNGIASVEVLTDDMVLIDTQDRMGDILAYTDNGDGTITAPALVAEATYTGTIGKIFESSYTPSLPVDTTQNGNLTFNVKRYLQYMGIVLGLTGQFTVDIEGDGFSDTFNYNLSELPTDIYDYPEQEYIERVSVMAKSGQELKITIRSNNQFPLVLRGLYFDFTTARRRTSL